MTFPTNIPSRKSKDSGFSLLEMIVVLSVVSMVAVVGLAGTQRNARKATASEVLIQLQTTILTARSAAISSSKRVQFEVHLENGTFSIDGKRYGQISKELKVDFTGALELVSKESGKLLFNPDGSSSGGTIEVIDVSGGNGSLTVNWITGIPRIERGQN